MEGKEMAKVAEGMARVVSGITADRRQRSELAAEIKVATRRRHGDVQSFLKDLKASRIKATREQAIDGQRAVKARHDEVASMLHQMTGSRRKATHAQFIAAKKATRALHSEVHSMLRGLKATRVRATRAFQKDAAAVNGQRKCEVKAMMDQFAREEVARGQHRQEVAAMQREQAAAFMLDLTNGIEVFRDKLAKEGRDRASEIREKLAAYGADRREGMVIWRGNFRASHPVMKPAPAAIHKAEAEPAMMMAHTHEAPASANMPAKAPEPVHDAGNEAAKMTAAAPMRDSSQDEANRNSGSGAKPQNSPGKQQSRNPAHGGSDGRHGGHSK